MISGTRIFGLVAGMAGPLTLLFAPGAMAQDGTVVGAQPPVWSRPWVAIDRCAAYGPQFTSVEGSEACVRIGGHVRVQFGSQYISREDGWGGAAPAAMRTEGSAGDSSGFPQAQHLRLRQSDSPAFGGAYLR